MNTYNLTEIELTELLRKQRELVYNHARVDTSVVKHNGEWIIRANYVTESFMNAPLPPLPSGAKKEDIQPVLRWVKVEERLPDERPGWSHSEDVNVLLRNTKHEGYPLFVSTGCYQYLGTRKWCEYLYGDRVDNGDFEVVAWQPLPQVPSKSSQKQAIIDIMEADQRDGIYEVSVEQELLECYKKAWVAKNSPDYDAEGHPHYYADIDYTSEFNSTVFCELVRELVEDTLLNSDQNDNRSVATKMPNEPNPDPQKNNLTGEPVIDNETAKEGIIAIIKDCLRIDENNNVPNYEIAEARLRMASRMIYRYLKSNSEPVIDWEGLEKIRNYFGEHDKTPFEHWAYTFLNNLLKNQ